MAKRAEDWDIGLAKDLRNRKFAQEFILSALEDGVALKSILAKIVRAYGIVEFSKRAKMAPSNISRAIRPKSNPTVQTLNRLLRPFGLRLGVMPITEKIAA